MKLLLILFLGFGAMCLSMARDKESVRLDWLQRDYRWDQDNRHQGWVDKRGESWFMDGEEPEERQEHQEHQLPQEPRRDMDNRGPVERAGEEAPAESRGHGSFPVVPEPSPVWVLLPVLGLMVYWYQRSTRRAA